jgi:hypothetical protein
MASKESGMVTVAAPRIRIPRISAWTVGMLVVAAAGFVLGQLLEDSSETVAAAKTATASFSVDATQQSRALNETTVADATLPTFKFDAVGDVRALNEPTDVISRARAADAARLQSAAHYYLDRGARPALTLPKRGEVMPWDAAPSSLYTAQERATMAAVANGLVPNQVLASENFLVKKFINQGLIPRQAVD